MTLTLNFALVFNKDDDIECQFKGRMSNRYLGIGPEAVVAKVEIKLVEHSARIISVLQFQKNCHLNWQIQ